MSVKSEKTTQLDIGAQYNGVSTHAWISSYLSQINDFILFKYDPKYARSIEINNVDATVFGGEMGIGYAFNAHWKVASLTHGEKITVINDHYHRSLLLKPVLV